MSIRLQLNLLIVALLSSMIIAIGLFFGLRMPAISLEQGKETLHGLSDVIAELRYQAASSLVNPLEESHEKVTSSRDKLETTFTIIEGLESLRRASDAIEIALLNIQSQQMFIGIQLDTYVMNLELLIMNIGLSFPDLSFEIISDVYNQLFRMERDDFQSESLLFDLGLFHGGLRSLCQQLDVVYEVVEEQSALIDGEINRINERTTMVAVVSSIVIVLLGILFGWFISIRIYNSFKLIQDHVTIVSKGDISSDFAVKGHGEIGQLSAQLNLFLGSLRTIVLQIKEVIRKNVDIKKSLATVSSQSSSSLEEMRASIGAVSEKIGVLDHEMAETAVANQKIASSVTELDELLLGLSAMVEETSASIVQMIASIANVAKIAVQRRESAENLVRIATDGGDKLSSMTDNITAVDRNLDDVNEVVEIIMNIATQTNLLAMNAAIEAAHAGDAGRGFSVVAEEIRNLAEAVNEQSKTIKNDIQKIVMMIKAASSESNATLEAFKAINDGVNTMDKSFAEIAGTMAEIDSGGQEINKAVIKLREIAVKTKEASQEITINSKETSEAAKMVSDVAGFVKISVQEISAGSEDILGIALKTVALSQDLTEETEEMNKRVAFFKL